MTKSLLGTLNFVDIAKPTGSAGVKKDPMKEFTKGVETQLAYVKMQISGNPITTGSGRAPRLWYLKNRQGLFAVWVNYGTQPVNLNPDPKAEHRNVINAGKTLEDVEKVLNTIKAAADAKEPALVQAVEEAFQAISARLQGRRGKGKGKAA
jgi:hypothetical protein